MARSSPFAWRPVSSPDRDQEAEQGGEETAEVTKTATRMKILTELLFLEEEPSVASPSVAESRSEHPIDFRAELDVVVAEEAAATVVVVAAVVVAQDAVDAV